MDKRSKPQMIKSSRNTKVVLFRWRIKMLKEICLVSINFYFLFYFENKPGGIKIYHSLLQLFYILCAQQIEEQKKNLSNRMKKIEM